MREHAANIEEGLRAESPDLLEEPAVVEEPVVRVEVVQPGDGRIRRLLFDRLVGIVDALKYMPGLSLITKELQAIIDCIKEDNPTF